MASLPVQTAEGKARPPLRAVPGAAIFDQPVGRPHALKGDHAQATEHSRFRTSPGSVHEAEVFSMSPAAQGPSPLQVPSTQVHATGSHVSVCLPQFPQSLLRVSPILQSAVAISSSHGFQGFQVLSAPQVRICLPHAPQARLSMSPGVAQSPDPSGGGAGCARPGAVRAGEPDPAYDDPGRPHAEQVG